MVDRYRELEGLKSTRKLDVVLMATVSSFGALGNPASGELRRFAELFPPVYEASSVEARRQAVAALSALPNIPQSVCRFIGSQEIAIAATFLARSPAISDETLIGIIESMGEEHVRAIIHRNDLSQRVVEALIGTHRPEDTVEPSGNFDIGAGSRDDTEALRQTLKAMAAKVADDADDRLGLSTLSELQTALLVRFARRGETPLFLETFARALGGDRVLAHRIIDDISGRRLAMALVALGMNSADTTYILPRLCAPLAGEDAETENLVASLKPAQCIESLLVWQSEREQEVEIEAPAEETAEDRRRRSA
ncbi:DUF2336 domain-containing protein [Martelella endophytica]|uniref:DUF2336 domain-containing protein n=1 Tax=Martelella endophytica TaxID=1486262 RepID=UPI0006967AF8|nr:DUF2336 domain-containing protein [Martelella endophytica]